MNREPGFFNMDFINMISTKSNLQVAKGLCLDKIDEMPNARPDNIRKAKAMVINANTLKQLLLGLGNFVLAHESPKNRVIR